MANTIILKNSGTASKVPLTTDLVLGELAINTYDGVIYLKKNDGSESVVTFATDENLNLKYDKTGGALSGSITIDSIVSPQVIFDPSGTGGIPGLKWNDDSTNKRASIYHDITSGDLTISRFTALEALETSVTLTSDGNVSVNGATPTADSHLTRKDFVDDNFVPINPAVITGTQDVSGTVTIFENTSITDGPYVELAGNTYAGKPGRIAYASHTAGTTGEVAHGFYNYDTSLHSLLTIADTGDQTIDGSLDLVGEWSGGSSASHKITFSGPVDSQYISQDIVSNQYRIYGSDTTTHSDVAITFQIIDIPSKITSIENSLALGTASATVEKTDIQLNIGGGGIRIDEPAGTGVAIRIAERSSESGSYLAWENGAGDVVAAITKYAADGLEFYTNNDFVNVAGILSEQGNFQIKGHLYKIGDTSTTLDIYQHTSGTQYGPTIQMTGSTNVSKGRIKLLSCTDSTTTTDIAHQFLNWDGTAFDVLLTLYANGKLELGVDNYTKAHIGNTSNGQQVVSTSYLKSMTDFVTRGTNALAATTAYVLNAGIWTIVADPGITLNMHNGSDWEYNTTEATGTLISDGTNMRLYNSTAGSLNYHYLHQGLQR